MIILNVVFILLLLCTVQIFGQILFSDALATVFFVLFWFCGTFMPIPVLILRPGENISFWASTDPPYLRVLPCVHCVCILSTSITSIHCTFLCITFSPCISINNITAQPVYISLFILPSLYSCLPQYYILFYFLLYIYYILFIYFNFCTIVCLYVFNTNFYLRDFLFYPYLNEHCWSEPENYSCPCAGTRTPGPSFSLC